MQILRAFLCAAFALGAASDGNGKKVSVKEVVFDSSIVDIQWLAKDHKTVLVTTSKGRLYRSTNGGDKWNDITDQLKVDIPGAPADAQEQIIVESVKSSPVDKNVVMVVGTKRNHFISINAGETWRRVRQRSTIHTWLFHKKKANWALLSTWTDACSAKRRSSSSSEDSSGPCNHMLYITKDLGRTFTLVTSYVVQFSWGDPEHRQQDRIYFSHFRQKKGDQPKLYSWSENVDFSFTDDAGSRTVRLVQHGNKFLVAHSFIFVAKLKSSIGQTVNLMVSSDGGRTFRSAQLAQELAEKSYTVLDTSEGTVIMHVNHGNQEFSSGVGNVYVSDKDGVRYSLSLANNVRGSSGDAEFDKVLSLEGVYMANVRDKPKTSETEANEAESSNKKKDDEEDDEDELEKSSSDTAVDKRRSQKSKGKAESIIRTVISYDKGGAWNYLKAPKVDSKGQKIDCPPDRCWLHMHGITNFHNYAPFYSVENAIGLIMGTGNIGPYLRFEPDQVNTFLSRDGGLTWAEAHKGAFIYEFGDHGGLMVMADDIRKTKQVVFSWNEGQSWYDFELGELPVEVDNVVTEPNATSTQFLLYGTRGDTGVLYHLDFDALGQPACKGVWAADSVSSDYETWVPSDGRKEDTCILGRQVTYTRRKATSECFNGEKFERPIVRKNCACTESDFVCEMGFSRKVGSLDCKLSDESVMNAPKTCTSSSFYYVDAHRKVVGDLCEGGWQPQKAGVPCPANSKMSSGAMSVLGSMASLGIVMAIVTYLSRSERFKGWFSNYGFDAFNNVKYATIGAQQPETGLESVGARYDSDFMDADQDDYHDDAPQLMTYVSGGDRRSEARRDNIRRAETPSAPVPKLAGPPGSAQGAGPSGDGDGVDLL